LSQHLVRGLFLRLLAGVYLVAFASFWVQAAGLIGPHGLLPAGAFLDAARESLGADAYRRLPTLLWISQSAGFLHLLCGAGVAVALAAIAGLAPLACFALLWALYLSLVAGGQDFMSFQWDVLLLEAGIVALFQAPARLRSRLTDRAPAPGTGIWLARLLVWKLMFLSGATKLLALDPTWWKLTALDYHYSTQPLPWWTSWYAHQLPSWLNAACVAIVLLVELGAPWLIFVGRRGRLVAFLLLVGLQLAIAWTGNYGFFNLLSIVLCVALLDDRHLDRLLPTPSERRLAAPSSRQLGQILRSGSWARPLRSALALALVAVSLLVTVRELARTARPEARVGALGTAFEWSERRLLEPADPVLDAIAPFHSVNGYGLFRSMTTTRPEIVLEASADGTSWTEIEFRWKPGDPGRRPRLVAPHQPRLDWQMWFAALDPRGARWLGTLMRRVLEGEDAVLDLLDAPEWRDRPPRYVRLRYWRYQLTDRAQRRATGAWWRRESLGELTGRISLEELERSNR
jgi:lipase maturation factor 1